MITFRGVAEEFAKTEEGVKNTELILGIPSHIGSLYLLNYNLFCPLQIQRFFQSAQYTEDMRAVCESYDVTQSFGYESSLFLYFEHDKSGNLRLRIDVDYIYLSRPF